MKPIRSLAVFIFGIIVGIVLTIGGTAFAGYLIVTKTKMGDIEDKVIDKAIEGFDLPADIRELLCLTTAKTSTKSSARLAKPPSPISSLPWATGYPPLLPKPSG